MREEYTVLDYVKSKLFFWRGESIEIPPLEDEDIETDRQAPAVRTDIERDEMVSVPEEPVDAAAPARTFALSVSVKRTFWVIAPLVLALIAQFALEPPGRSWRSGLFFYFWAAGILLWGIFRRSWALTTPETRLLERLDVPDVRAVPLVISIVSGLIAFLAFGGNRFTGINVTLWIISLLASGFAFWHRSSDRPTWDERLRIAREKIARFKARGVTISASSLIWTLIVLTVFALAAFYRFYRLESVPPEMFSDHAEKLIDVGDVLAGQLRIFFPRNTGREAFQMYLTAAMAKLFDTGLSFLSLKLGTALCGLFTLPFIYLLGKEVANRRVGLWAMAFAGIAYWPNVISRVALRFTLYPFFAAPTLYFLVRALKRRSRNDFILAGFFLGLGLHGYSTFRLMPLVVVGAVGLYLLHRQSRGARWQTVQNLILLAFIALLVFAPLLRYALSHMSMFNYRSMTRLTGVEVPLPGPAWQIFFKNLGKALVMFFWDNGEIWVHSVAHRPALDVFSAALFFLGVVLVLWRYLRVRHWQDIFLLLSIPLLLLPSVLSLAFPAENPSLNRTGGALIPVFVLVGIGLDTLLTNLQASLKHQATGAVLAWGFGFLLFVGACFHNYDLVFVDYQTQFKRSAWNTSELGAVIRQFADTVGEEQKAWVVRYPHWVDTRLVGIHAGVPGSDYALWPDQLSETLDQPGPKMFLFKPDDTEAMQTLRELYPQGQLDLYQSEVEGKDFYIYFVPSDEQ